MTYLVRTFGLALFALASLASAQTFTPLYDFQGGSDGGHPFANLTRDASGNFYGTTYSGGNLSNCPYPGCGVVYKVDAAGNEVAIHTFAGPPGDGANPTAGVVTDPAGVMYGTTKYGGTNGYGTVYAITSQGKESILQSFSGGADGGIPNGGLVRDQGGNLYGTTYAGGTAGFGTVFKVTPSGRLATLYSFPDRAHGSNPNAALLLDGAGNLYGTTQYGGTSGYGTIFKVNSSGQAEVLYSFSGGPDGAYPQTQLVSDRAGNLYGTTTEGGASNFGTIFRLGPDGTETVLYSFAGNSDGGYPMAGVILDASGDLYGTTFRGGSGNSGTIYKLDPQGHETLLYAFAGSFDGASPAASLIFNPAGTSVYGTAENGGYSCCGALFQVTLP